MTNLSAGNKNVVFVLPLLCAGGAERAIITLCNNLNRDKFNTSLLVLDKTGPAISWIKPHISIHSLGEVRTSRSFFKLKRMLKQLDPDVVITTMAHSNFLLMLLKPFFPTTKFIIREAAVPSSVLIENNKKSYIYKALYKLLYPKADIVLSPSQDIINDFKGNLNIDIGNHKVLYNQIDVEDLREKIPEVKYPCTKKDTLRLVCVGRLSYQKGYDRLLHALKKFAPPFPWKLIILGDGEERKNLEELIAKYRLEGNVFLNGAVSNPGEIIAGADMLLLPSRWEGMPNVVLESLACGTKVLATADANGVKEICNLANEGDVIIVPTAENFLDVLTQEIPQNKLSAVQPMLPEAFRTEAVMLRFEGML